MKLIAIDAGHGVNTPGKRTPLFKDGSFMRENEFNRGVADYLDSELHRCGFRTLIVTPELDDISLSTRVNRANEGKADAYISIHANAFGSDWNEVCGVESYVYTGIGKESYGYKFVEMVHRGLVGECKGRDRGVKWNDFFVLRETDMLAVLVECGFMTNLKEAELLRSDEYRRKCARGICKGICEFYGVEYKGDEVLEQDLEREKIYNSVGELPEWAKGTIQKLIDKKYLTGDTFGLGLTLTAVKVFVVNDRAGVYGK